MGGAVGSTDGRGPGRVDQLVEVFLSGGRDGRRGGEEQARSASDALVPGRASAVAGRRPRLIFPLLVGELAQYEDIYRLCYVRGPEGIIVGLAEQQLKACEGPCTQAPPGAPAPGRSAHRGEGVRFRHP